jgi:alpha-galactosidase
MLLQLLWLRHLSGGASPLNGLGATPQMGYNSWYDLMCTEHMNEATIRGVADALVKTGLARAGFVFVNLDDCYIKDRLPNGTLAPDPKTFPSGMRSLANYIHNVSDCQNATCADTACADCTCEHAERNISLCNYSASAQLRFGVYTDRGSSTCAGRPAAQGHEAEDARTYAEWQVDYLKEDSCHAPSDQADAFRQYGLMRDSLNQTGRPIFFSLCGWNSWYAEKGASLGNSWRVGPDDSNWQGIIKNIDIMAGLTRYAGKNKGWNDPCLLLSTSSAGKQLVTEYQSRSQFSMWSVMSAPLLISGSILNMSTYTLETYLNRDVIAVNQDSLGVPGERVAGGDLQHCAAGGSGSGSLDCTNVWAKPLQGPSAAGGWPSAGALVFFNAGAAHADVRCDKACWAAAGFDEMLFPLYITDLWNTSDVRLLSHPEFTASQLPPRGGFRMVQVGHPPHTWPYLNLAAVLAEIYLCKVCSCQEILRRNGRVQVGRPPQVTELPHLSIPHCKNGNAVATNFKNDRSPPPSQAANQSTTVRMCWNRIGLQVSTNASDTNIFNTATQCNAPVFSTGDVLEVFVGPVRRLADVPAWYLELDTASSGALWGEPRVSILGAVRFD